MGGQAASSPRWISFDCYGTLIDWEKGVRQAARELALLPEEEEEYFFPVWERIQWEKIQEPYLPYAEILRLSFRLAAEELGYRCAAFAVEAFVESVRHWEPFPDVLPALRELARRHRLAIISNVDRDLLGQSLRHLPVRFGALITAQDARAYKPSPALFRHALERLACSPDEVVHVAFGAAYDLEPASALGMRVVHLNRHQTAPPKLALEAEIQSLEELSGLWSVAR